MQVVDLKTVWFGPLHGDTPPTPKRRKNAKTESIALLANVGGKGVILECNGGIQDELEAVGSRFLDDYGLDDAPDGLSIWEGRVAYSTDYFTQEVDSIIDGVFRDLTDEEWRLLQETGIPWEELCTRCENKGAMIVNGAREICPDCAP